MCYNTMAHMMSCEAWDPLVEEEGVDWSPNGSGRSSDSGNDPIPPLVTDKYNPSTVFSCTSLSYMVTMIHHFTAPIILV